MSRLIFAACLAAYIAAAFGVELPALALVALPPALVVSGIVAVCRVAEAKAESEVGA